MGRIKKQPESPLRMAGLCRGEGLGYVLMCADTAWSLTVRAVTKRGVTIPCEVHSVSSAALREKIAPDAPYAWVAVLPLLSATCTLHFFSEGTELASVVFPALRSKVHSRMLSMRRPQVAEALRGFERLHGSGRVRVRIYRVWAADAGELVWRVRASFPMDHKDSTPQLQAFDMATNVLPARIVLMEDQIVPSKRDSSQMIRLVTFSCRLPEATGSFFVVASIDGKDDMAGFDSMNAARAVWRAEESRRFASGAEHSADYPTWFARHRASDAELARQRDAFEALPASERPLISLVMPVYQTPKAYLVEAIDSVCAQSYGAWELVVVNASGTCAEVDEVLAACADERVRVINIKNQSISQNTNAGIEAARGDYVGFIDHDDVLEPDALWHMAAAIRKHPSVDLLYSDEDHLSEAGVHAPAFKTYPNYGKLYGHNYVTHLLVVSKWALDHTERSGADVAGAQDYDLTLKVFEVARDLVHVPRVLYHWREHENSTSGGSDQKPYAHEAGKRALAAHLERRGIAAQVTDGVLPYTYRVCYELPTPAPKVSIVIPTRDQAELLRACVTSILGKTTYPAYEVVLVENNSQDARTFELYDELARQDERVRMVVWEPPEPGTFNYSALVNFGVAHATGELVVLLNNDTEVIEPRWLEEMAGCLMRPEVGVVGAKLLFGDGLIQHVGMIANPDGDYCHVCQNLPQDALGPSYAAMMPGDYSMVTGACQMVSRALYNSLGGYDEELAVGFNDGDFCLRAREAGYATTVCAHAVLRHREFSTRGREVTDTRLRKRYLVERAHLMTRHAAFFAQGDPAINPNLDPRGLYFDIDPAELGDDTCF